MSLRIAGIGSGFETTLPLVHSDTLAKKRLSVSALDTLHAQLKSGAHRHFGQGARLLIRIVLSAISGA